MIEPCLAPGIDHILEWIVAEFGSQLFKCKLCGYAQDVIEDSQT